MNLPSEMAWLQPSSTPTPADAAAAAASMAGVHGGRHAGRVTAAAFAAATLQAAEVDAEAAGAGIASALFRGWRARGNGGPGANHVTQPSPLSNQLHPEPLSSLPLLPARQSLRTASLPCATLASVMGKTSLAVGRMGVLPQHRYGATLLQHGLQASLRCC